jgi:hypothetical protein
MMRRRGGGETILEGRQPEGVTLQGLLEGVAGGVGGAARKPTIVCLEPKPATPRTMLRLVMMVLWRNLAARAWRGPGSA